MKISILQCDIHWCDAERNRTELTEQLRALPESDICVLPEMFNTGFCMEPAEVAEEVNDSPTLRWMQQMAHETGIALTGSFAVKEEGRFYNRLYFVTPEGECSYYDKSHLFTYGGERRCYTPGDHRLTLDYKGCRFLLQVCYDLRFPVFSRCRGANDYEAIIYVANWPTSRRDVWNTLLKARALENQCFVIGVNRIGEDLLCPYNGGSQVFDAYGNQLAVCQDNVAEAVTVELELEKLHSFRDKFRVLEDRDLFQVGVE